MIAAAYIPEAGDVIWVDFDPQSGREQVGHRPAVVLSSAIYNRRAGLLVCCPTTTKRKGYPFEVALSGKPPSVALADHVKSLDWRARHAVHKSRVTDAELASIRRKVAPLLGL